MCRTALVLLIMPLAVEAGRPDHADPARAFRQQGTCVEMDGENRTTFEAVSDARFTEREASNQAKDRLLGLLIDAVAAQTNRVVPKGEISRWVSRLVCAPDTRQADWGKTIRKPYGTMHRHGISLSASDRAFHDWAVQVVGAHRVRRQRWAMAMGFTVLGCLCAPLAVVKLDRWTRGYHRPAIVTCMLLVVACTTLTAWTMVLY